MLWQSLAQWYVTYEFLINFFDLLISLNQDLVFGYVMIFVIYPLFTDLISFNFVGRWIDNTLAYYRDKIMYSLISRETKLIFYFISLYRMKIRLCDALRQFVVVFLQLIKEKN